MSSSSVDVYEAASPSAFDVACATDCDIELPWGSTDEVPMLPDKGVNPPIDVLGVSSGVAFRSKALICVGLRA